jgi:hypothetical protein
MVWSSASVLGDPTVSVTAQLPNSSSSHSSSTASIRIHIPDSLIIIHKMSNDAVFVPKMAAITVSMVSTGVCAAVTLGTNFLFQSPSISPEGKIELGRGVFMQGGRIVPPAILISTSLFCYVAYKQPGKFTDSPYARAGLLQALGIPFTGLVMVPYIIKQFISVAPGAAGIAAIGGDAGACSMLLKFGNINIVRALIFGAGAVLGLRAALNDTKRV